MSNLSHIIDERRRECTFGQKIMSLVDLIDQKLDGLSVATRFVFLEDLGNVQLRVELDSLRLCAYE